MIAGVFHHSVTFKSHDEAKMWPCKLLCTRQATAFQGSLASQLFMHVALPHHVTTVVVTVVGSACLSELPADSLLTTAQSISSHPHNPTQFITPGNLISTMNIKSVPPLSHPPLLPYKGSFLMPSLRQGSYPNGQRNRARH